MAIDAVPIFAEGSLEEQVNELLDYLLRSNPEEEEAIKNEIITATSLTTDSPDQVFLRLAQRTTDLGSGSEREIEGYFNLLTSHLLSQTTPSGSQQTAISHLTKIIAAQQNIEHLSVQYRLLSNLFNSVPRESPLRLEIYSQLLNLAVSHGHLDILHLSEESVTRWLREWDVPTEAKADFLKKVSDAYRDSGSETQAYRFLLQYLKTLSPSSAHFSKTVLDVIVSAVRIPTVFDFDTVKAIIPTSTVLNSALFSLLDIFVSGQVSDFEIWIESNSKTLDEFGLERMSLLTKIRCLTMASICCTQVGSDIPYSKIAEALKTTEDDVDAVVIDVIRSGLVSGKLSQTRKVFYVTRSTTRTFDRSDWELLEKKLIAWKSGLEGLSDVLANAQKQRVTSHFGAQTATVMVESQAS